MRTLNVKLMAIVLVVVIVLTGSAHLLHSYQLRRHSESFKTQARAAWNDNPRRDLEAVRLMWVYVLLKPNDYEAREELGFWFLASGRFSNASTTLEELLRALEKQNPPNAATIQRVRRKLIDAALAQGRCADAAFHLEALRKELPGDADILNVLGKCKVTLGREEGEDGAIKNFSEAIKLRPDRVDIYYNKSMALRFPPVSKLAEAEKCMAEMIAVEANAKSAGAHHVYGMWLSELGKFDQALKQAEITLSLHKDHAGGLYLAGQSELALRHFPKAEEYARRGMKAAPQDFAMYTLMADVMVRNNQRGKAIGVLNDGIKICQSKGAKAQILWHLANLYLDSRSSQDAKSIADAEDCLRKMREYRFSSVQMDFLDARVLYANDEWKMAREGFEKVRPRLNDFPQLMKCLDYWIGYCYLQQGNPDQAMAAFRRSLSFDKFYYKAHDGIAQIFIANGQLKDAVEEYRQAVIGNPIDIDAAQAFARTLVLWNLRRPPAEQEWEATAQALQRAEQLDPHEGQIKLMFAEMLLDRGLAKEAGDLIKRLREDMPKGVEYRVAQAHLAARRGDVDEAKKILDDARSTLGDHVLIRLARALIALRESGNQAGAEIEKLAGNADTFSPDDRIRLWKGLLKNLIEIKEYDRAKGLCRLIARQQPHDAVIRYRLFELALTTHDVRAPAASLAELDRLLEEIDAIAEQGPLWMYGKAVRLKIEAGNDNKAELLEAAMACAKQAQQMRLSWSRPHVLQGEIWRQRGNNEEALEQYLQASINGDQDLEFIRLLLQMLFERQRYHEAEQVIHRLDSSETPLSHEIEQKEAQIFALWGDFARALECAKNAYDPASGDYREHVWHGQVLKLLARRAQREGHLDRLPEIAAEAEKSLRRACQIAPNTAECRVGLVQLLVATNQMEKARIAASDAQEMISLQAAPLAMGYIYEALGETKWAGKSYEKAVAAQPDLPLAIRVLADFYVREHDIQRATPLIDRLLSGAVPASEGDLVSARRMKAAILVNQGYSKLKEATELVDRNLASSLAQPEDKRLKVRLFLADPRRARDPEVLDLAESLVMTGGAEPDPDDRYTLARLYLDRGEWDHSLDQMEILVNSSQPNPLHMADYVRMLLDQDQLGDADLWLERLKRISSSGLTVGLQAELLHRRKEWSKVPDFLATYVKQAKAPAKDSAKSDKDRLERILFVAGLLERMGGQLTAPALRGQAGIYFEKAREWYESFLEKCPGNEMLLAGFHARHGKVAEALQRIERSGEKANPREVFQVVGAIVARPETTPAELEKLEAVVVALLDKTHRATPLLIGLAEIQSARGRFQDSEKIYREVLAGDPNDDTAGNNLSMILALEKTRLDEALALIDKVIERAGPLAPFLDTRAVVLIARHESRQAIEDLEFALAMGKTPPRLFHMSWACYEEGNSEKAKQYLQAARNAGLEDSMLSAPEREICRQIGVKDDK